MLSVSGHIAGLGVSFERVSRSYGDHRAVDEVDLTVAPGEFLSLVGPSGSGKTSLLMMLAGFETPDSGRILVGGKDVSALPPNKRNLGVVFQKYALFPHRTVAENIGFPLRMRGMARTEREARVQRALSQVRLEGYGMRLPAQLSGGQQQRVALARAIVFDPPVILMDEPLGALDRKLRQHMQIEIKQLQQQLGATVIYVTHDQDEALSMSDRVAVFDHGRVVQVGPPREVYDHPETEFAAGFLGEMNFLPAAFLGEESGAPMAEVFGAQVGFARCARLPARGSTLRLGVRPERVWIERVVKPGPPPAGALPLIGRIAQIGFAGARCLVLVELAEGATIRADLPADAASAFAPGDGAWVGWNAAHARVFEAGQ